MIKISALSGVLLLIVGCCTTGCRERHPCEEVVEAQRPIIESEHIKCILETSEMCKETDSACLKEVELSCAAKADSFESYLLSVCHANVIEMINPKGEEKEDDVPSVEM